MVVFKLACFDGFHVAAGSWIFWPPGCSPRTSEIGTDLRAVRPRGAARRDCLPWGVLYLYPVRRSCSAAVRVCWPGAFGEIALPRRRLGVVGSQQQSGIFGKLPV